MNILDHIFESLETIFLVKILKFFDVDEDPELGIFLILDPGWKKIGFGINISDPHSATLLTTGSLIPVRILDPCSV